ncbi:MAG TPA: hypothetical protein VF432_30135 [Thermoanaerobaculia bacterium]
MIPRCTNLLAVFALWLAPLAWAHPGSAIGVNPDGRVYFVDTGGGVFSIEPNGEVVRREGPAFHWFALDPAGRFRSTPWPAIPGGELRAAGGVILSSDLPVAVAGGTLYFPERVAGDRIRIVAVAPTGARSVRATLPPARRGSAAVPWINGLAPGPNGSLYYTEDRAVRIIDARGRVTTLANVPSVARCAAIPGVMPEEGPYLRGLAVAGDGTVYVAAAGCGALLKITPRGAVAPLLRTASPWSPTAVATAGGEVFVLEYSHTASDDRREWHPRVRKITRSGAVVILANPPRR